MKSNIKKIIELRKLKKFSIKRFAEILDISTRTVYNWEANVSQPRKIDLIAIAHILNVKLEDISSIKESSFYYSKPELHKSSGIKESTEILKGLAGSMPCEDYAQLLPFLHAEDEISGLMLENSRILGKLSRFKLLFDLIDSAVYVKNFKRVVTFANQAFINTLPEKLNEYDIVGHKFSDVFSNKLYNSMIKIENEAFKGSYVRNAPILFPFRGTHQKCRISVKPVSVKNKIVHEIIASVTPFQAL